MLQTTLAGKFAPDANQCSFNSIAIIPTHTTLVPVEAGADGKSDTLPIRSRMLGRLPHLASPHGSSMMRRFPIYHDIGVRFTRVASQ